MVKRGGSGTLRVQSILHSLRVTLDASAFRALALVYGSREPPGHLLATSDPHSRCCLLPGAGTGSVGPQKHSGSRWLGTGQPFVRVPGPKPTCGAVAPGKLPEPEHQPPRPFSLLLDARQVPVPMLDALTQALTRAKDYV